MAKKNRVFASHWVRKGDRPCKARTFITAQAAFRRNKGTLVWIGRMLSPLAYVQFEWNFVEVVFRISKLLAVGNLRSVFLVYEHHKRRSLIPETKLMPVNAED